jgi:POT family proton-dependent oligopeptide transporter
MSAIWLLTVAAGNLFDVYVNNSIANHGFFSRFEGASYYWLFAGIMTAFILVYLFVSPRLKERNYVTEDENKVIAETNNL